MKYRPVGGQKINAVGRRNRDSPRTVWLRRTSEAVLSIWARSSPHTCFLGWTPAGRRRALEMNKRDWSETDIDLKRHWCILNQYSLVFNTEQLYFHVWEGLFIYSVKRNMEALQQTKACLWILDLRTSPEWKLTSALTAGVLCLKRSSWNMRFKWTVLSSKNNTHLRPKLDTNNHL